MRKLNKNNGITLIALIISVIIMLILVAVSINIAVDGGIFNYTEKAVGDTQNAINQEQELIDDIINNYIKPNTNKDNTGGEENGGTTPENPGESGKIEIPEGLKAGDYVNYIPTSGTYTVTNDGGGTETYTTDSSLKWRVWSINEKTGEIELISNKEAHELYLYCMEGYNNAVDILNNLCKELYSNEKGATARSINIEDINAKTTYKVTEDDNYKELYGKVYTLNNVYCPAIYPKELGSTAKGLNETRELLKGSEGIRKIDGIADYETYTDMLEVETLYVTYTAYEYNLEEYLNSDLGINTVPLDLICTGGDPSGINASYFLASRCVYCDSEALGYNLWVLEPYDSDDYCDDKVSFFSLDNEDADGTGGMSGVRPIVSLPASVQLTKDGTNSTDSVTYWNIEY